MACSVQHCAPRVALLLLLSTACARASPLQVMAIVDGDTVHLRDHGQRLTVRLACIDAPETSQTPWGPAARRQLQRLLPLGQSVTVRGMARDRYGREIAELFSAGQNVNQALVASGQAFVYWAYIKACDRQTYGRLETQARLHSLGIWSMSGGITRPWLHRHSQRKSASPLLPVVPAPVPASR